jgi:hypothetical protein
MAREWHDPSRTTRAATGSIRTICRTCRIASASRQIGQAAEHARKVLWRQRALLPSALSIQLAPISCRPGSASISAAIPSARHTPLDQQAQRRHPPAVEPGQRILDLFLSYHATH